MKVCLSCNAQLKKNNMYCSNTCQQTFQKDQYIKKWLNGEVSGNHKNSLHSLSKYVRNWMFDTMGTQCSVCGRDDKHPIDGRHLTEIDHIDGDASNSKLDNLRILCPNCHSKTSTFKNRNKKSARKR